MTCHKFNHGTIYQGDCLELMESIPDGSVDLIVIDPPYNIGKAEWDKIENYVEWMGGVFSECERVLKDNGSFYFFHNDFLQIVELQNWLNLNGQFMFKQLIVWSKPNFRCKSWTKPTKDSVLRNYFNVTEYCLFYVNSGGVKTKWDETGLQKIKLDVDNFSSLRKYFYNLLCWMGETNKSIAKKLGSRKAEHAFYCMPKKKVIEKIGQKADHCFRYGSTQWELPTKETYQELIDIFHIDKWDGFRPYESKRQEYESKRQEYESKRQEYESLRYTFNPLPECNNVFESNVQDGKNHVCEKPLQLIERFIETSSNPGETVLDCFIGSGTTGVAAHNTGRRFIGMEKDEEIYSMAVNRIDNETRQLKLFENLAN